MPSDVMCFLVGRGRVTRSILEHERVLRPICCRRVEAHEEVPRGSTAGLGPGEAYMSWKVSLLLLAHSHHFASPSQDVLIRSMYTSVAVMQSDIMCCLRGEERVRRMIFEHERVLGPIGRRRVEAHEEVRRGLQRNVVYT